MRSSEEGGRESDHWQHVRHETNSKEQASQMKLFFEAVCKSFGTTALCSTMSRQEKVTMDT